jgi:hypothetical protein
MVKIMRHVEFDSSSEEDPILSPTAADQQCALTVKISDILTAVLTKMIGISLNTNSREDI